jgi:glycosyltransferase involved in cell wall biosynthesis
MKIPDNLAAERKFIDLMKKELEYYSYPKSKIDITENDVYENSDVINLHWVADFLDWETFFKKNKKPLIWTLHDQNPFLGGKHYEERYYGIDKFGYPINRRISSKEIEMESCLLKSKLKILSNINDIHIVTPSKWMMNASINSDLFGRFTHHHIPYGFPENTFKLLNKNFCREILCLPFDKRVILFVADSLGTARKGIAYLDQALQIIRKRNFSELLFIAVGGKDNFILGDDVINLGKIRDERMMSIVYGAADVFVIPSLEDNSPNTIVEANLCGTPAIGFDVGGIGEIIVNKKNGLLCTELCVKSLADSIVDFFENIDKFDRELIALQAKEKYKLSVQAKAYKQLFHTVLNG